MEWGREREKEFFHAEQEHVYVYDWDTRRALRAAAPINFVYGSFSNAILISSNSFSLIPFLRTHRFSHFETQTVSVWLYET